MPTSKCIQLAEEEKAEKEYQNNKAREKVLKVSSTFTEQRPEVVLDYLDRDNILSKCQQTLS